MANKENRKIMLIIPTLGTGGAERLCMDIAKLVDNQRFSVTIVSLFSDVHMSPIYASYLDGAAFQMIFLNKRRGFDLQMLLTLRNLIRRERPDVIHSHIGAGPYAALCLMLGYTPLRLHTVHTLAEKELSRTHKIIMHFAYRCLGVKPVAISKTVQQSIQKVYNLSQNQALLINNGIRVDSFPLDKIKKTTNTIEIISVGSLFEHKRFDMLLSTFALLLDSVPNCRLTILGDGKLRQLLENQAKQLQIEDKVFFRGIVENVRDYMMRSDIFALASDYEGFGLVIAEAMSCGLPVVSTRNGGAEIIIDDMVDGFLVPTGNAPDMAEHLKKLALSEEFRKTVGVRAYEKSKSFDINIMVKNYETLYEFN